MSLWFWPQVEHIPGGTLALLVHGGLDGNDVLGKNVPGVARDGDARPKHIIIVPHGQLPRPQELWEEQVVLLNNGGCSEEITCA